MKYCLYLSCFLLALVSCNNSDYSPKPNGYYRIEFPEKDYQTFNSNPNFEFEYPVYAHMYADSSRGATENWYNLAFPAYNARLHLSYFPVKSQQEFFQLTEDSRKLAFKHTVKATGIDEALVKNHKNKVYGIYYTISGNTASSLQFYLTDSSKNYLRGALYFNERPKQDSIQPVVDFIREDVDKLIRTLKWKK
jgi:gliding motility-associated lipoprotein GldD